MEDWIGPLDWQDSDIILLQETWALEELPINGYETHFKKATKQKKWKRLAGGSAVYASLKCKIHTAELPTTNNDLLIIKKTKLTEEFPGIILVNVYVHPGNKKA